MDHTSGTFPVVSAQSRALNEKGSVCEVQHNGSNSTDLRKQVAHAQKVFISAQDESVNYETNISLLSDAGSTPETKTIEKCVSKYISRSLLDVDETIQGNYKTNFRQVPKPMEKRRVIRNLFLLGFGHFLLFTAFDSLSNLQSTMNSDDNLGVISQAVIYGFFTFSSFFLPTFIIRRFGCKLTLVLSVFSVCPYVAANIYPHWGTLIPSAVICGLAFGPLWAARSTYVNEISFQFASYVDVSIGVVNAYFFGIYSLFHENAEIWGNVISYVILRSPEDNTQFNSNATLGTCGAEFCKEDSYGVNPNLVPPSNEKRITLSVIYMAFILIAALIIGCFLDPLAEECKETEARMSCSLLVATLKHLKKPNQILLVLLSFYCGVADGFYNSDYTKAFIGCAWGIPNVGFVTICYGVVSAVIDCLSGPLVKCLGRPLVFVLAAASHFVMLVILLLWRPNPDVSYMFFFLSGIYGLGASIWWSQITAFYGVLFKNDEEAAFSNFYFWSSLGFLVAYSYSDHLCTYVKIYILLSTLGLGILCYLIVELRTSHRLRNLAGIKNEN